MIMPREKREIQKEDIMPLDVYTEKRRELRKSIVDYKKNRRVALGPYATFYFESYETMLAQYRNAIHEKEVMSNLRMSICVQSFNT